VNLVVPQRVVLKGILIDNSGAAFASTDSERIAIQLRDPETGTSLSSGIVDQNAKFSPGAVEQGSHRLIAVMARKGHVERLKGWEQPDHLMCANGPACDLKVTVKVGYTDNPVDFCPPK
jgi:hypothetical protein